MERERGVLIDHFECIHEDCVSSDAMAVYEKEDGTVDAHCYSCKNNQSHNQLANSHLADELGIKPINKRKTREVKKVSTRRTVRRSKKEVKPITPEQIKKIRDNTSSKGNGFRGIKDKWLDYYRIRTEYDEESGEVSNRYYPVTLGKDKNGISNLVGYHKRIVLPEKDFRAIGLNSKECELFGQFKCKGHGKLVLCGGQEDVAAAKQMFEEYRQQRGVDKIAPIDFVSGTVGETSLAEQIRYNYEFVDGYDEILVDMDDDIAGENAVTALLEVLPMHKVKLMSYSEKDANAALDEGIETEWVRSIYNARKPKISGIVSSLDLHEKILEAAAAEAIPLPPILNKANEMLSGGLPLGEIVNLLAGSGVGKTTIVGEFTYYWVFNSPHKIGVLSYEAIAGQYGLRLLSRHLGTNILKIVDRDEEGKVLPSRNKRIDFLKSEEVIQSSESLYRNECGDERFALIDDRDEMTTIDAVKRKITQLIKANQVKVLIIDPVSDLLSSMDLKDQAAFCSWLKKMKSQGITFILVNHSRKGAGGSKSAGRGGELDEQDMLGTGDLYRSGAVNIIIERDKEADSEVDRNTTKIRITKNRDGSETGKADEMYYEYQTAKLHNKEDWLRNNGSF